MIIASAELDVEAAGTNCDTESVEDVAGELEETTFELFEAEELVG